MIWSELKYIWSDLRCIIKTVIHGLNYCKVTNPNYCKATDLNYCKVTPLSKSLLNTVLEKVH